MRLNFRYQSEGASAKLPALSRTEITIDIKCCIIPTQLEDSAEYPIFWNKRARLYLFLRKRRIATLLADLHTDKIHRYYNSPVIAAGYGRQDYITPCERLLFDTYIQPGMAILDIGVGGGRTSQYLARNASRYVGIDYASEMVRICREKYPQWEYLNGSATDLSALQSGSFDVIVMSYNVLDDLIPNERRWRCLQECHRVLRDKGFLVFSSHNPYAILVRRDQKKTKARSSHMTGLFSHISALCHEVVDWSVKVSTSTRASVCRAFIHATKVPFWLGEGYMLDSERLMTHFWIPRKAIAELTRYGFRFIALQGDDYPKTSHLLFTEWYYYVFQR